MKDWKCWNGHLLYLDCVSTGNRTQTLFWKKGRLSGGAREILVKGKVYRSLSWRKEEAEGLLQSLALSSLQWNNISCFNVLPSMLLNANCSAGLEEVVLQ